VFECGTNRKQHFSPLPKPRFFIPRMISPSLGVTTIRVRSLRVTDSLQAAAARNAVARVVTKPLAAADAISIYAERWLQLLAALEASADGALAPPLFPRVPFAQSVRQLD
jgi:hypothetical protein